MGPHLHERDSIDYRQVPAGTLALSSSLDYRKRVDLRRHDPVFVRIRPTKASKREAGSKEATGADCHRGPNERKLSLGLDAVGRHRQRLFDLRLAAESGSSVAWRGGDYGGLDVAASLADVIGVHRGDRFHVLAVEAGGLKGDGRDEEVF